MLGQRGKVSTAFAQVRENGFEVGDNAKGGSMNGKHLEKSIWRSLVTISKTVCTSPHSTRMASTPPMEAGGKTHESGFYYLLECHKVGVKNDEVSTFIKKIV